MCKGTTAQKNPSSEGCLSQLGLLCQEYHGLGGLNNRNIFLTILEARKSKVKTAADLVSGEIPLSGLQVAIFSLYSHQAEKKRDHLHPVPSCKGTKHIHEGFNHNDLVYLPKVPSPHTVTLGIQASKYEIWGRKASKYSLHSKGYKQSGVFNPCALNGCDKCCFVP